jgi:hypothetical protein
MPDGPIHLLGETYASEAALRASLVTDVRSGAVVGGTTLVRGETPTDVTVVANSVAVFIHAPCRGDPFRLVTVDMGRLLPVAYTVALEVELEQRQVRAREAYRADFEVRNDALEAENALLRQTLQSFMESAVVQMDRVEIEEIRTDDIAQVTTTIVPCDPDGLVLTFAGSIPYTRAQAHPDRGFAFLGIHRRHDPEAA